MIQDFDSFLDVVGSELLAGLIKEEYAQLLTGSGIGANLTGLLTTTGILTVGSAGTDLDAIAAAFLAIRTGAAHCDPDVVVMHPGDWFSAGFLLARDTAGQYLVGDPVTGVKPSLCGVPAILSEAMTENTAMVANLSIAATAWVRQAPVVEVAPYGGGTTEFIAKPDPHPGRGAVGPGRPPPRRHLHRDGGLGPARRGRASSSRPPPLGEGDGRRMAKERLSSFPRGDLASARPR